MRYKPHPRVATNVYSTTIWAVQSGIRSVNNTEVVIRSSTDMAEAAMSNKLLLFNASAHNQSLTLMIDNGCDTKAILNLSKMSVNKLQHRQSFQLSIHGSTGMTTTTAYRIPHFRLSVHGVTRTIYGAIAAHLPAFDPAIVLGKPFLAEEDVHIDHRHNIISFPDGQHWLNPLALGQSVPEATWTHNKTNTTPLVTNVPPPTQSDPHITMKAARKKVRSRKGSLYQVRVDLSCLSKMSSDDSFPEPSEADPTMLTTASLYQIHTNETGQDLDTPLTPSQIVDVERLKAEFTAIGGDLPHESQHPRHVGHHPIDLYPGAEKRIPFRPPNRMAPDQMIELKKQLKYLLEHGFLRPSRSPIATLVFFVPKPDKEVTDDQGNTVTTKRWRMVVDYRALNRETVKDRFPCPDLAGAVDRVAGHKYYSAIDLTAGFWQLPIRAGDEFKTAITTPLGLFEWTVMPFGLTNAPASFNRITQKLFGHTSTHSAYCEPFVDDIGIFSNSWDTHLQHVKAILKTLRDNGLYANLDKCHIGKRSMKFLGEVVSELGRRPDPDRISAITSWPKPQSHKDVRVFLGMTGYLSPYIPAYSAVVKPLNKVRQGSLGSGGHQPAFHTLWGTEQQTAFEALKQIVTMAPVLRPPHLDELFYIQHDASNTALGAVLLQRVPRSQQLLPVAFASRSLVGKEPSWPTHDLELEGLRFGLERFSHYFGSRQVITIGDHKPLLHIRTQPKLSTRQLRVMEAVSGFNFVQLYWSGTRMKIADMLSRSPNAQVDLRELTPRLTTGSCEICAEEVWKDICSKHQHATIASSIHHYSCKSSRLCEYISANHYNLTTSKTASAVPELSPESLKAAYKLDSRTVKILISLKTPHSNHTKRRYALDKEGRILERTRDLNDPFAHGDRLVLPAVPGDDSIIRAAIRMCHVTTTSGHAGVDATFYRVRSRFSIRGAWGHVLKFVQVCQRCQYSRHSTQSKYGLSKPLEPPIPIPGADLSTDFTFGLPPAEHPMTGIMYEGIQVWIDRLSRRVRLLPVNKTITAEQCATLYRMEVASQWGQMRSLVSDRDPRFTSGFWIALSKALGTKLKMSSPRNPQTDGQSEQAMSWISVMLRSFCGSSPDSWVSFLPDLEFCINSSPSRTRDNLSPFQIWQGFEPLEAVDLVAPHLASQPSNAFAMAHVDRQRVAVQRAMDSLKFAQDESSFRTDQHRTHISYAPGDYVTIHRDYLLPPGEHHRLKKVQDLYCGPFAVVEMVGELAVKVDLPSSYRQHNVFHVSGTRPWTQDPHIPNPLSRPAHAMPDGSGESDPDDTFMVGSIRDHRFRQNNNSEWLVEWKGYNRAYNSWERLSSFVSNGTVTDALQRYERARTGSNQSLLDELHRGALPTVYSPGAPGTQRHTADGYNVTYTTQDESLHNISQRLHTSVKDLQAMNKNIFSRLTKNSQFDEGTAVRYEEATLSPSPVQLSYLVTVGLTLTDGPHLSDPSPHQIRSHQLICSQHSLAL